MAAALAVVTACMHLGTLSNGWRFDDGTHLLIATRFEAWEYFFVPSVTNQQSMAGHVTPWNAFFYDVNLRLFGFTPAGFYAHQLVVLWLTSIATAALLRRWLGPVLATFGAVLFLIGAPTADVANALMTGHYAAGLLFSVCGMLAFVLGVERRSIGYGFAGATLYLLALSCKEVFAPFPALLLFLPAGTLRTRVLTLLPFVPVALFYVPWRHAVLGEFLGSYDKNLGFGFEGAWEALRQMPYLLAGPGPAGSAALLVLLGLALHAGFLRRTSLLLILASFAILTLPLVPLHNRDSALRYCFVPWWGWSAGSAALLSRVGGRFAVTIRTGLGTVLVAAALLLNSREHAAREERASEYEALAAFVLQGDPDRAFYSDNPQVLAATRALVKVADLLDGRRPRPRFVTGMEELGSIDLAVTRVFRYDKRTRSIRDISAEVPMLLERLTTTMVERPLWYRIERRGDHVEWNFGPYDKGRYYFESRGKGLIPVGRRGSVKVKKLQSLGRIRYESPEGWVTTGPPLDFPADDSFAAIEWVRP